MAKFKVTQAIVNRGGKKYTSQDGVIEVDAKDVEHFEGFEEVKPKPVKNESTKKTD
tara:strand:+ start:455 stop:622 length:168 start_codon:yes stop_codon:yes gene_type:complete